jgi:hypothetical protein
MYTEWHREWWKGRQKTRYFTRHTWSIAVCPLGMPRRMDWSVIERNGRGKPIALATRPQRGLILGQHFNKTNSTDGFEYTTGKLVVNVKQIRVGFAFKMHIVHDKT